MSTFKAVMPGCCLGEIPTGTSIHDLKERAQVAAQKAAVHEETGDVALARVWKNAATRLRAELRKRLASGESRLGEIGELVIGGVGKAFIGGSIVAAGIYGAAKYMERLKRQGLHAEET